VKHHGGVGSALRAPLMDAIGAPTKRQNELAERVDPPGSLVNTGDVGRVVWFVPTRNLRRQVRNELAVVGV
jgi:hypothetical protein